MLLDNYSEISDKVYFDLKDEIVDNITELALCAVLKTWAYLDDAYGEDFEFKYYYEHFLSSNVQGLNQSIIADGPVDTYSTSIFTGSLTYTKDSGFWDANLDYTSDLKWDLVGADNWCKRYFPDEWKVYDHKCNHTAKDSPTQAVKGFRFAKLLMFFKNNIHQYV